MGFLTVLFCVLFSLVQAQYFQPQSKERTGRRPVLVAACDWSGDGVADAAVADHFGNSVSLFVNLHANTSSPMFVRQTITPAEGPFGIACLDINSDGRHDLVWGNDGSIETGIKDTLSYILNLGPDSNGMVQFTPPVTIQIGRNPSDISIADFNSDGADDIAVTITDENKVTVLINNFSNSTGVDFTQIAIPVGVQPYDICVADFNSDGKMDVALTNYGSGSVSVLENTGGNPVPIFVHTEWPAAPNPLGIWAADYSNDGKPDIVIASQDDLRFLENSGTLNQNVSFTLSSATIFIGSPVEMISADFDSNGHMDIAVTNYGPGTVVVLMNSGVISSLAFEPPVAYTVGLGPWGIDIGDFNYDGVTDLAVCNLEEDSMSILIGSEMVQPTAAPFVQQLSGGAIFGIIVGVMILVCLLLVVAYYAVSKLRSRAQNAANDAAEVRGPGSSQNVQRQRAEVSAVSYPPPAAGAGVQPPPSGVEMGTMPPTASANVYTPSGPVAYADPSPAAPASNSTNNEDFN